MEEKIENTRPFYNCLDITLDRMFGDDMLPDVEVDEEPEIEDTEDVE